MGKKKYCFTFWEPEGALPGYLQLCIKSWQKALPGYELVVLNYDNLFDWMGADTYDGSLYRNFSLMHQADAIRCAVLNKHGGLWLDADTVVVDRHILREISSVLDECDIAMLGSWKSGGLHLGCICAKSHSALLEYWQREIAARVLEYEKRRKVMPLLHLFKHGEYRRLNKWNYLGNAIVDPFAAALNWTEFQVIDRDELGCFPEKRCFPAIDAREAYQRFYFGNAGQLRSDAFAGCGGLIYLHNSWTPSYYKEMDCADILRDDRLLSRLLRRANGIGPEDKEESFALSGRAAALSYRG